MKNPTFTRAVICNNCGTANNYYTKENGPHLEAICKGCDKHIKFLPSATPTLYVGKYKGLPISDIEDVSYLEWAQKTLKLSAGVRDAINYRIQSLNLTHR